jgi:hypothetical protein
VTILKHTPRKEYYMFGESPYLPRSDPEKYSDSGQMLPSYIGDGIFPNEEYNNPYWGSMSGERKHVSLFSE